MTQSRKKTDAPRIPKSIIQAADRMYMRLIDGYISDARRLRRNLITRIYRELDKQSRNTRLWCLLGDLYTLRAKKMDCHRKALKIDPRDPESNAEIAKLYAGMGNQRYRAHFDRALELCCGVDMEESIIYAALQAAQAAGDAQREHKAMRLGRRRFPDCILFHKKKRRSDSS